MKDYAEIAETFEKSFRGNVPERFKNLLKAMKKKGKHEPIHNIDNQMWFYIEMFLNFESVGVDFDKDMFEHACGLLERN